MTSVGDLDAMVDVGDSSRYCCSRERVSLESWLAKSETTEAKW